MDYRKLGLKCGIEIHQQLDTGKLFCRCSSAMSDSPSGRIMRKLRVVAGELGEVDRAAAREALRGKEFFYQIYPRESCLVEMDEEPPGPVNAEAMEIALMVSLLLECCIPDEVQMMRKTVLDGSNTTGFQRTAILGIDGALETSQGEVRITNVSLEEEASQILARNDKSVTYGLNRLCIPLVEIGTAPDIKSPEHAREVAEKLGMILRSTGRVRRGIGTIRQDINISVRDGARIEIKGAQELRMIPRLVENEISRQLRILEIGKKLRGMERVKPRVAEVTDIFRDTDSDITKGKRVFAMDIPGFRGFFKEKLTPTRTLGNEIAGYVKAEIGAGGFVHNDENLEKYRMETHFERLRKRLKAKKGDTIIIVAGDRKHAEETFKAIGDRINAFRKGIPEETRRALANGDTEYLRPLPGASRMYPETDVPPVEIAPGMLEKIRRNLPEMMEDRAKRLEKTYGLSSEISRQLVRSGRTELFEEAARNGSDPRMAANVLTSMLTSLRRDGVPVGRLTGKDLLEIFAFLRKNELTKKGILDLLKARAEKPGESVEKLAGEAGASRQEIEKAVRKAISEHRDILKRERPEKALMGLVMKELGGRASGKSVMEILVRELKRK